jgi:hypothetical protein
MEPGGGTAVGAVESLLTSSCFRKGAESRRCHRSPGSGEAELPMVPSAGPDCLLVSLCQVAPQSEWRRRRCPSVRPVSGAAK